MSPPKDAAAVLVERLATLFTPQNAMPPTTAVAGAREPQTHAETETSTDAASATATAAIAAAYDALGGGARDHSAKPAVAKGVKAPSTRSSAPLISAEDFAARIQALGGSALVGDLLPRLAALPKQMRILTLEALFSATGLDELHAIVEQTTPLLQ